MASVYRHIQSGDLYVVVSGGLGRNVGLDGRRFYELEPVSRLVDTKTGEPVERANPGEYYVLSSNFALRLTVSQDELNKHFFRDESVKALQNSPIEALMAHYEAEECDFSNREWVVSTALRLSQTMPDSQARCLLYTLALSALG